MTARVVATSEAERQILTAIEWWREHREKAPELFEQELDDAEALLSRQPTIGTPFPRPHAPQLRRLLLRKTGFFIFYVYLPADNEVRIRALWSARRGHGPPLE